MAGTSKSGNRRRFIRPVVPEGAPLVVPEAVKPVVPLTGTQKGYLEREKERVFGKGSLRGKPYGQAQPSASPPLVVEAPKSLPGLSEQKDKDAARRDKQRQDLLQFMQQGHPALSWCIEHLARRGYDPSDVECAYREARMGRGLLCPRAMAKTGMNGVCALVSGGTGQSVFCCRSLAAGIVATINGRRSKHNASTAPKGYGARSDGQAGPDRKKGG